MKTVLITGGTGSFGQAFVRYLLAHDPPSKIIVFSRDELKQHEMAKLYDQPSIRYFVGDVRDVDRLRMAFDGVDVVVHAAAMKQVPACEYNPFEAVKTNILGAENVIRAARNCAVEKVVAISSDKAVNPVNLYGATKMVMERLFVHGNVYTGHTRRPAFSVVRYGNVMGSRGSVVPLFLNQSQSGTLTITDPRMTRFWMTLDRACQLVIDTLENMVGGEIVIPADLPAMSIVRLAHLIAPQAQVVFTGIRPGEKLHESLISEHEVPKTFRIADCYEILPPALSGLFEHAVLPDFEYTSETAVQLTDGQAVQMIGQLPEAKENKWSR